MLVQLRLPRLAPYSAVTRQLIPTMKNISRQDLFAVRPRLRCPAIPRTQTLILQSTIRSKVELIRMANIDFSAWDASKAWAAGAKSSDPAAFYNAICAGKKAGDPKTQEAHAL